MFQHGEVNLFTMVFNNYHSTIVTQRFSNLSVNYMTWSNGLIMSQPTTYMVRIYTLPYSTNGFSFPVFTKLLATWYQSLCPRAHSHVVASMVAFLRLHMATSATPFVLHRGCLLLIVRLATRLLFLIDSIYLSSGLLLLAPPLLCLVFSSPLYAHGLVLMLVVVPMYRSHLLPLYHDCVTLPNRIVVSFHSIYRNGQFTYFYTSWMKDRNQ